MAEIITEGPTIISSSISENSISDDQNNQDDPDASMYIKIEDIRAILEPISGASADVTNYIKNVHNFQMQHKILRINRGIRAIREKWPTSTPAQIFVAFDMSNCCIDDLMENLDDPDFVQKVDAEVKARRRGVHHQISEPEVAEDDSDSDASDGDYIAPISAYEESETKHERRMEKKDKKSKSTTQIPPAPDSISPEEWASWSEAHRNSYLVGMSCPNTFLYRNPPPGVKRKNGPWSEEEHKAFMRRLKEIRGDSPTIDGNWGIFSLAIPGRVGYVCSNYYRRLILEGQITDCNYLIDSQGKLHHKSHYHGDKSNVFDTNSKDAPKSKKSRKRKVQEESEEEDDFDKDDCSFGSKARKGKKRRTHQKHFDCSVDENSLSKSKLLSPSDVETFSFYRSIENPKKKAEPLHLLSRYEQWALQNPLPKMVDDITNEKIKVPALAPDGYVLDYQTWLKMLGSKNESPFTREPVHKRDLIILTVDNINQYMDKILNLNNGD